MYYSKHIHELDLTLTCAILRCRQFSVMCHMKRYNIESHVKIIQTFYENSQNVIRITFRKLCDYFGQKIEIEIAEPVMYQNDKNFTERKSQTL